MRFLDSSRHGGLVSPRHRQHARYCLSDGTQPIGPNCKKGKESVKMQGIYLPSRPCLRECVCVCVCRGTSRDGCTVERQDVGDCVSERGCMRCAVQPACSVRRSTCWVGTGWGGTIESAMGPCTYCTAATVDCRIEDATTYYLAQASIPTYRS